MREREEKNGGTGEESGNRERSIASRSDGGAERLKEGGGEINEREREPAEAEDAARRAREQHGRGRKSQNENNEDDVGETSRREGSRTTVAVASVGER